MFVLALIVLCCSLCTVFGSQDEHKLVTLLLSNYNTNVRPVDDHKDPVDVAIEMVLNQVTDMDERKQVLTIKVWMRLTWNDHSLKWNPGEYGGLKTIQILANFVWRPDITLYNDVSAVEQDPQKFFSAVVKYDGTVKWNYPSILYTACTLDVTYFPFDLQKCRLQFGSWGYDGSLINVWNVTAEGNDNFFVDHGEWTLVGLPIVRNVVKYPDPYSDVMFWVVIQRKPFYYIFNMILPAIFLTFTTNLVFYLPPDSGEKMTLSVTVLLALTFFLLLVAETMPIQSDVIPLIGKYFGVMLGMVSLSTVSTVVILNVYHRGSFNSKVPRWVRTLVFDWIAEAVFMHRRVEGFKNMCIRREARFLQVPVPKRSKSQAARSGSMGPAMYNDLSAKAEGTKTELNVAEMVEYARAHQRDAEEASLIDQCRMEWKLMGIIIDRFLLYFFIIITAVMGIVCLSNRPHHDIEKILANIE